MLDIVCRPLSYRVAHAHPDHCDPDHTARILIRRPHSLARFPPAPLGTAIFGTTSPGRGLVLGWSRL
jgi:hypothetical protein